jgi:putative ABC transport system ATP-binding protein
MFRLDDVAKHFNHRNREIVALHPTSLEVGAGELLAIVGPSGSGKTTLLSTLGGMLAPTSGTVWFEGRSLYAASPRERAEVRQRRIGFVFQTFNLIPYLTALENVEVPLMLAGSSVVRQHERAATLLVRVGLGERLDHKPNELSVGQQQRVALARTLANDPAVILADEPTGNLDPPTREEVLDFFGELCREGRTVIMVTHDPAAAARAHRTIELANGGLASNLRRSIQRVA